MAYKNYAVSSNGYMYEKSKEPKEGFESVKTLSGKISIQRKADRIEGVVKSFQVKKIVTKEVPSGVSILELVVSDGQDNHTLSFGLKTQKGSYTREAEALISAMNGYEVGHRVSVAFTIKTTKDANQKEWQNYNFWINYLDKQDENGKNPSTGFIPFTEVPKAESKIVAGETQYNYDNRVEFYYNKLQEISTRIGSAPAAVQQQPQTSTPTASTTPTTSTIPAGATQDEDLDDLPFG